MVESVYVGLSRSMVEYCKTVSEDEARKKKKQIIDLAGCFMQMTESEIIQFAFYAADKDIYDCVNSGREISCTKGCSHCCHIFVACTNIEATHILKYLKDNQMTVDIAQIKRLAKLKTFEDYEKLYIKKPKQAACPFLLNNECSIYSVRPLTCRKYMALTPAQDCIDNLNGIKKDVNVKLSLVAEIIDSALLTYETHKSGTDQSMISLAQRLWQRLK